MKYSITVTDSLYKSDSKEVENLKELGFVFEPMTDNFMGYDLSIQDSNIYVEINTLEELIAFNEKYGRIIFDGTHIEIYNGYRE